MSAPDGSLIPKEALSESVILHIAFAYFSIAKELEKRTGCSQTRGFILSTLRNDAERNQNQIAKLLGFDRTVVHRTIKSMIREGLLTEKRALTGRALLIRLTPKGGRYRQSLVAARRELENEIQRKLAPRDAQRLSTLLKKFSEQAGQSKKQNQGDTKVTASARSNTI